MKKLILCMCFCLLFGSLSCGAYAKERIYFEREDNDTMSEADHTSIYLTEGKNELEIEGVVSEDDLIDWHRVEIEKDNNLECRKGIAYIYAVQADCQLECCLYNPQKDRYIYANDRGMIDDFIIYPGDEYYIKIKYVNGPISEPYYITFKVEDIIK